MRVFKKVLSLIMIVTLIAGIAVMGTVSSNAAGTGTGLAEWAMRAYNESWSYVWGGASVGAVDCSGMITSYCGGNRTSMLADAQANGMDWGYVSNGIPNVHGLGLSRPNHVGVYVGNGMEIDARGSDYGICYQAVGDRWECWFKLTAITYPTTGWQSFNGSYYYYENGEYITDTSRTIDGVTYYFGSSGASSTTPGDTSAVADTPSSTTADNTSDDADSTADDSDDGPLRNGSTGPRVEELQERLRELGYYNGAIDGDFGDLTEEAFRLFQEQAGLYVDGIAGSDIYYLFASDAPAYVPIGTADDGQSEDYAEDTDAAEDNEADGASYTETAQDTASDSDGIRYAVGDYSDAVYAIQEQLIKLGYLDDDADGSFGSITEAAVKEFQTANKLEVTGVVDQATYDKMFSGTAVTHITNDPTIKAEQHTASKVESIAATTAKNTAVERDNAALSQKAVAGINNTASTSRSAATTNFEFIIWLGIMIVIMLVTFSIVYAIEKKKARAMAFAGRRFQ